MTQIVEVEVVRPFTFSYPVVGDANPDFVQEQLVPGSDGHLVKRPVAYRRIVGTVDYTREEGNEVKVIAQGCGPIQMPAEHAEFLSAKGLVKVLREIEPVAGESKPKAVRRQPTPVN